MGIFNINALKAGNEDDWVILKSILEELNVPAQRMNDIHWLNRNLLINNEGPETDQAMAIIQNIMKAEANSK